MRRQLQQQLIPGWVSLCIKTFQLASKMLHELLVGCDNSTFEQTLPQQVGPTGLKIIDSIEKNNLQLLQHAELMGHLRAAGYAEVQLHLLIFGNTGPALGQLGIAKQARKSLLEKTLTGTGLIMAHTRQELRIDPNGKDTTNPINRAELVGVVSWLEEIMREELATGSTFKLLTDSRVTLQSI